MTIMNYFYLNDQRKHIGPVTLDELQELNKNGQIKSSTLVIPKGGKDWIPLSIVLTTIDHTVTSMESSTIVKDNSSVESSTEKEKHTEHSYYENKKEVDGRNIAYYSKCGKKVMEGSIFCSYCGVKLLNVQNPIVSPAIKDEALFVAAFNGDTSLVKSLLDKGVEINAKDNDGCSSLMLASYGGHTEIVELLLDRGSDINAKDDDGETALINAIMGRQVEIVAILIDKGADIEAKNNNGRTALMIAVLNGDTETVELLRDKGADIKNDNPESELIKMGDRLDLISDQMNEQSLKYDIAELQRLSDKYEDYKDTIINEVKKELKTKEALQILEGQSRLSYIELVNLGNPGQLTDMGLSVYRLLIEEIDKTIH
jgi:hypothetical protein